MKTNIDVQTLLGFFSATGLPAIFKAVIAFLHPSIYTLTCGVGWVDGVTPCYADERDEAIVWLALTGVAVAYGVWTLYRRLGSNPTPTNTVTVTDQRTGQPVEIQTVAAPAAQKGP